MNLQSTDFEIFNLPQRFALNAAALDAAWKTLQRQAHPDRHASDSAQQQRQAMQWSVRINEAYQRLKQPIARAAYLCELRGVPIRAENNTAMPSAFLMQQMQWREALDEATHVADLDTLDAAVDQARRDWIDAIERLDGAGDTVGMAQAVRALMFVERFEQAIEKRHDELGQ
ncbi:MAG: Fe-S protein assembly co-chaperone HscB [Pseudomonadota bacterium]|jgi:molecular chaperone HscB